jgi:hypothetical protein
MAAVPHRTEPLQRLAALREIDWDTQLHDPSGDTSSLSFLSGFGLGTLIGIIVAIALAPQSGRRVREQVRQTSIQLRHRSLSGPAAELHDATLAEEGERAEVDVRRRLAEHDEE